MEPNKGETKSQFIQLIYKKIQWVYRYKLLATYISSCISKYNAHVRVKGANVMGS